MQSQFRNGYICYGQKNIALILKYLILNSAQIRTLWFTASHAHTNAGNFNVSPSIASFSGGGSNTNLHSIFHQKIKKIIIPKVFHANC